MNNMQPSKPTDQSQPVGSSESEGQIRETIHMDAALAREPQAEAGSEIGAGSANAGADPGAANDRAGRGVRR